ncbi:MAG TPA: hypothetical protein VK960_04705 [Acidimicrobiia bacterium]|nr:hypothetical protein [Acidimicrobiia bacterium]
MRRLIVMASLLALVTMACRIETNFGVVINADGSGLIVAEVGMDETAQQLLGDQMGDPFGDSDLSQVPNAVQRTETRGDFMFWVLEVPVDDVTQVENEVIGDENSPLTGFDVEVTDTLVSVRASATASEAMGEDLEGFDPAALEEALSFTVQITMPGRITSHNADSREGNTLIWRVPLFGGGPLDVQAQSDPSQPAGGGGGGIPVWVWIAVAVVAIGGGLYWYMQQQGKGGGRAPDFPSAPTSEPDLPPPPPPAE